MGGGKNKEADDGDVTPKDKKESASGKKLLYRYGNQKNAVPRQPKFEGMCDELKGHVYDCSDARQADLFIKTTKEVAEFVGRTYKYGGDIRLAVENLQMPNIAEPYDPPAGASRTQERIWEKQVDEYVKQTTYISENIKTLYSLVWGQCTDIMRQKIEALHDFEEMSTNGDGLALLKAIKNTAFSFQSQKYFPHSLYESTRRFYMTVQGKYMTNQAYLEQFQNMIDVIVHTGGMVGHQPGIIRAIMRERGIDPTNATTMQQMEIEKEAQNRYLAVAFMLGSDKARFGRLLENLENDYLQGQNNYPTSITAAYNLLPNWKQDPRNLIRTSGPVSNGVLFTNVDGEHGEQDIEVSLKLDESGKIPKSWILLDNQYTVDVF